MRRVVITGLGIVSSIGNGAEEVAESLKAGRSGISFAPEYAEHGFRSQVHGRPQIEVAEHIDKRQLRFMGDGAAYAFLAMQQAIADAGLEEGDVSNERTGLIAGSGGPSTKNMFEAHRIVIEKGPMRLGLPFSITVRCASNMLRVEGPPEPAIRPVRSFDTSASSSPASAIACCIAR